MLYIWTDRRRTAAAVVAALLLLLVQAGPAAADASELHILLVIDSHAGKRGGNYEDHFRFQRQNLTMLDRVINDVYHSDKVNLKDRLFLDVLEGDKVSPEAIRKYYTKMPYAPQRSLMFYFCGHGSIDPKKGHFFATSGGDVLRSEIYNLMTDTGGQGIFIFSDCCSTNGTFNAPKEVGLARGPTVRQGTRPALSSPGSLTFLGTSLLPTVCNQAGAALDQGVNANLFYDLFYRSEGVISFTAASTGQLGFAGIFTEALTDCLGKPSSAFRQDGKNGDVSWKDFFAQVRLDTNSKFLVMKNGAPVGHESKKCDSQYPEAFQLGGWPTQFRRQLLVKNNSGRKIYVRLQYYDINFTTGEWEWYNPTPNGASYTLEAGVQTTLRHHDWLVGAHRVRISATSADGQIVWNEYSDRDLYLTPKEGYKGPIGQYTFAFNP